MDFARELPKAAWNAWGFAAVIMLLATAAMLKPKAWKEALNVLLGAWMAVLAIWTMASDQDFRKLWHSDKSAT
jgi:hypothetical protein